MLYASSLAGEIADDIVSIDNAMKWGFGWELGPFEVWDALGLQYCVERMKSEGKLFQIGLLICFLIIIPHSISMKMEISFSIVFYQKNMNPL